MLPNGNFNKIRSPLRGIMLKSHLFGSAKDLCPGIFDSTVASNAGVKAIVSEIHKRDALYVTTDVCKDISDLLNLKRSPSETFCAYELCFAAQLSKFNANGSTIKLPESMTAFMMLANVNVDVTQRVAILASAAPSGTSVQATNESPYEFPHTISNEDFIKLV